MTKGKKNHNKYKGEKEIIYTKEKKSNNKEEKRKMQRKHEELPS